MDLTSINGEASLIREVFLYANRFKAKRFVIQIAAELIAENKMRALLADLALLHQAGIKLVIVPGASSHIDAVLAQYGLASSRKKGTRISPPEQMPLIKMAAFNAANIVMTGLAQHNINAVIGNWVNARALGVLGGIDYHDTGKVVSINTSLLQKVMDEDLIPILPCIGWSNLGRPYNLSSIELASHIARELGAQKLFYLTDKMRFNIEEFKIPSEGIVIKDEAISRIRLQASHEFLRLNHDREETTAWQVFANTLRAVEGGVERGHILDASKDGVVLQEIFSTSGSGLMVHTDPFENIRGMSETDIPDVLRLMQPNIEKGLLVKRDEEILRLSQQDYIVFETDNAIRGCAALHIYEEASAEIAALSVEADFAYLGIGNRMVRYLIEKATQLKLKKIFLLTTQAGDFFEMLGFSLGSPSDLPASKSKNYNYERNSRVYIMKL